MFVIAVALIVLLAGADPDRSLLLRSKNMPVGTYVFVLRSTTPDSSPFARRADGPALFQGMLLSRETPDPAEAGP